MSINTNLRKLVLCRSCSSKGVCEAGAGEAASWVGGLQRQHLKRGSGGAGHASFVSPPLWVLFHIRSSEERLELVRSGRCHEADQY